MQILQFTLLHMGASVHQPWNNDYVRFEMFTAVTKNYGVFWNIAQRGYCKKRRFGGTYHIHHHCDKIQRAKSNVSTT
jgi:hypothetical protein